MSDTKQNRTSDQTEEGTRPSSPVAGVMARVRSEEPPDEPGLYWTEPKDPATGNRIGPEPAEVYRDGDTLWVPFQTRPDKMVGEVDYLWTGPIPTPEQISERREAP